MIYLVRHAEAQDAERDELRQLTERGRAMAARLGRFFRLTGIAPARQMWHSKLVRARQTAELIAAAAGIGDLREVKGLAPEDPPAEIARKLAAAKGDVMVVGHNPHLTALGTLLVKGDDAHLPAIEFPKCAALALNNLGSGEPGEWCIAWHLAPQMLDALDSKRE